MYSITWLMRGLKPPYPHMGTPLPQYKKSGGTP